MRKVISFALILIMLLNVTVPTVKILAEDSLQTEIQTTEQENTENKEAGDEQTTNTDTENLEAIDPNHIDGEPITSELEETGKNSVPEETEGLSDDEMLDGALLTNGPKDITDYVAIDKLNVWYQEGSGENTKRIYLIKDNVQQRDTDGNLMTILPMGAEFYVSYSWGIPHQYMSGPNDIINPYDHFTLKEPMAESLSRLFTEGNSYEIKKNAAVDVMGHFTVQNGEIHVILTPEAANAEYLEEGVILLNYKALLRSEIRYEPSHKTDQIKVEKRVIETPIGINGEEYSVFDKGGSQSPAQNGMRKTLIWTLHVNRDQLNVMTEGRELEIRKNIWVEDMLEDPIVSVIEDSFEFETMVNVMTEGGKVSRDAIYYLNSKTGAGYEKKHILVKPNPGESYEDFKARLKAGVETGDTKPFTVGLYPNSTTQAARVLVYFGSIGGGLGARYGKLFDRTEAAIIENMRKYMVPGGFNPNVFGYTITPEQAELTKIAYGLDGNADTPAKEVPYYTFRFRTLQDKVGPYNNTATLEWDGIPEKIEDKAIGMYTDASGQVGPGALTRLSVKKKWVGNVGNPVTVQLIADNNPNPVRTIVLNEGNEWKHSFLKLPMYRAGTAGNETDKIVYTVKEVMHVSDQPKYTETQVKDESGDIVIINTQQNIDLLVTKKWIGSGLGTENVTFDLYKNGVKHSSHSIPKVIGNQVWSVIVPNLPLLESGRRVVYSVVETNLPNDYAVTYDNVSEEKIVIYNLPRKEMKLVKDWDGRRERAVYISIYADGMLQRFIETPAAGGNPATYAWTGLKEHYKASLSNGQKALADGKNLLDHVVIRGEQNWEIAVENLPKLNKLGQEIVYTAQETHISDGTSTTPVTLWTKKYHIAPAEKTNDGFLFKNKELIKIGVEKRWEGNHGNGKTAILRLYKGAYGNELVSEAGAVKIKGNRRETFGPVKKYDDMKREIVYTVKEDALDGFEAEVTGDTNNGFLVVNKLVPSAPPYQPTPEETSEVIPAPNPKPHPEPKPVDEPKPEPIGDKPQVPNEKITENLISEGNSNDKPKTPKPGNPTDWIDEHGIPYGKKELPETGGIPVKLMLTVGTLCLGLGSLLKKKTCK